MSKLIADLMDDAERTGAPDEGRTVFMYRFSPGSGFSDVGVRVDKNAFQRHVRGDHRPLSLRKVLDTTTHLTAVDTGFKGYNVGQPLVRDYYSQVQLVLLQDGEPLERKYLHDAHQAGHVNASYKILDELNSIPDDGIKSVMASIMKATELGIGVDLYGSNNLFISKDRLSIIDLPVTTPHAFSPETYNHLERLKSYIFNHCLRMDFKAKLNEVWPSSNDPNDPDALKLRANLFLSRLDRIAKDIGFPKDAAEVARMQDPTVEYRVTPLEQLGKVNSVSGQHTLRHMIDQALEIGGPKGKAR